MFDGAVKRVVRSVDGRVWHQYGTVGVPATPVVGDPDAR
jgi:hypothetical protein